MAKQVRAGGPLKWTQGLSVGLFILTNLCIIGALIKEIIRWK